MIRMMQRVAPRRADRRRTTGGDSLLLRRTDREKGKGKWRKGVERFPDSKI